MNHAPARPGASSHADLLSVVYPDDADLVGRVDALLQRYQPDPRENRGTRWSEADLWLITYADQFGRRDQPPLRSLRDFYLAHLSDWINGIHILPFYPWSSDDGYSVVDYLGVDDRYGTWHEITTLAADARLIFDAVVNHMSARGNWTRRFLDDDPEFADYFISVPEGTDLSTVVRPRTTPLVTSFESRTGPRSLWTTFSADQVDLNYRNPSVFLAVLEVLLEYAARGAAVIRLDAVQYLWKEIGTPSINLPQGHVIIQALRACMDVAFPDVWFITETNVPHRENLSYLGEGRREAQLVYQFALPPLVLDAMDSGNASTLVRWLDALGPIPEACTVLNFLSSHDGVGLRPVEGLLDERRVRELVDLTRRGGGEVGTRSVGDRTEPYELNATWFSLMEAGYGPDEAISRHLASHAIMLALRGVPAIYAMSLVGARNDLAGFIESGRARSLNRARLDADALSAELQDRSSIPARVMTGLERMMNWRSSSRAFHPDASQRILACPPSVLGIERDGGGERARVYINVGTEPITIERPGTSWRHFDGRSLVESRVTVAPFQSVWLTNTARD